jgi:F-type H+/Na+-transporting ATPase subunit alpha
MINEQKILQDLEKKLGSFTDDPKVQNIGRVEKNIDGVITASGLTKAGMGEIIELESGAVGFILGLEEDSASVVLLGNSQKVKEGETVKTTGKTLTISASQELLGRVIDPLGNALDGRGPVKNGTDIPLECIAPGVVAREPVNTPLKTGIKAIDAMFPIGRGQRELIIGDRGLGKTALAVDTIINQRQVTQGLRQVLCVYVAIGQKQSSIARTVARFKEEGALPYTIVVSASAADPAANQYLAPYAGTAVAEYFLGKGEDVLVVYDDLTKHAWAYRQLSLVLRRPAGREAYPGDIFYLHSRLLERSVKLNKENGGGSITSLPIIETQAGDISAYIPTNVISITDGQIFLEADLFNSGIRPAINTGNSVSRVGSAAQSGAMKSVVGSMRLNLAQYRELYAFAQFGSELDSATQAQLERGRRITEVLKQPQYQPLSEELEILSIAAVSRGMLDDVSSEEVGRFEVGLHAFAQKHGGKLLEELGRGRKLTDESFESIEKIVGDFKKTFA